MIRTHLADNVIQDIRFAVRQLRKSHVFALTAIAILALGLCAAIAIFAFVDGALIRALPYQLAASYMPARRAASVSR